MSDQDNQTEVKLPTRIPRKRTAKAAKKAAKKPKDQWIEVFPSGITVATAIGRPVLLFKEKDGSESLPVWMQPLDAGVAMAELSQSATGSPHAVTRKLLEIFDVRWISCIFRDLIGHHQFVELAFDWTDHRGDYVEDVIRVRGDEAMSFCLQAEGLRYFCTREFAAKCRDLDSDIAKLETNLNNGLLPNLMDDIETGSKKHPYMM